MGNDRSYKHLAVFETERNGRVCFALACGDQWLCDFFDHWSCQLSQKMAYRTNKAYSYAVGDFLNYIEEISIQRGGLDRATMREAIDSYESYLVFGTKSPCELATLAAKALGSRSLGGASIDQHFAAVNNFIEQSENLAAAIQSMTDAGLLAGRTEPSTALVTFGYTDTPTKVQSAIKQNSWLAGCISGGYKRLPKKGLGKISKHQNIANTNFHGGDDKTFPYDLAVATIKQGPSLRDKLLWSHLAATGCRISEALTTLIEDVIIDIHNPINNRILIKDPDGRRNILSKYLSESEIDRLPHKGRNTEETFMIEPFASMFWKYLELYLAEERKKDKRRGKVITHRFLYRKLDDGEPCVHSYQTLYERFHELALKVTGESYGFHSFRHMYGYYLKNFCPNPEGGFGLSLSRVADYMGHDSINTTRRYAKKDLTLLKIAMSAMNVERDRNHHFTIANARLEILEQAVQQIKREIELKEDIRRING